MLLASAHFYRLILVAGALLLGSAWYLFLLVRTQLYAWRMLRKPRDMRLLEMALNLAVQNYPVQRRGLSCGRATRAAEWAWSAFAAVEDAPVKSNSPLP